jgi:pentapeptide repeat protein
MLKKGDVMIRKLTTNKPLFIGTIVLVMIAIGTVLVYWLKPEWTGFNEHIGPNVSQYQPGKKLWDWLQFFVIPAVLAIGGFSLNHTQRERAERAIKERTESERKTSEQRAKIADNNQYQATLQAYIDKLSELILEKKLLDSERKDELRTVASVQTLTVLSHLNEERRKSVIQFLYNLKLIENSDCIIKLSSADLKKVDLSGATLNDVDLSGANLRGASVNIEILEKQAKSLQNAIMPDGITHS